MRSIRLVLAGFLSLILLPLTATAAHAETTATYRMMIWNVGGWKWNDNSTTNGMPKAVANAAVSTGADVIGINELCFDQMHAIQAELKAKNWPQDPANFSRFEATNQGGDGSCDGEAGGIALFSRFALGNASRFTLPDDGRMEQRKLICAPPANQPKVKFCTTHITHLNTGDNGVVGINSIQLQYVLDRVEEFEAAGHTVIIGGDFNAQPNYGRMDRWYSSTLNHANNPNNRGRWRELDDTTTHCPGYGETTSPAGNTEGPCGTGKKLDLIFVRDDKYRGAYDADSVAIPTCADSRPCSDHRMVYGVVTVGIG